MPQGPMLWSILKGLLYIYFTSKSNALNNVAVTDVLLKKKIASLDSLHKDNFFFF